MGSAIPLTTTAAPFCYNCRVKLELHNYYQNQTTEWASASTSTIELAERLQHAKQLVQGLGLQAISN